MSVWISEIPETMEIKAGQKIVFPNVWVHTKTGLTPSKDIVVVAQRNITLAEALSLTEAAALDYVKTLGADKIRRYYIEDILFKGDTIEFVWAT